MQFMQGNTLLSSDILQIPVQIDREWLMSATVKEIKQRNDFYRKIRENFERR
jgi:hypothetical protein